MLAAINTNSLDTFSINDWLRLDKKNNCICGGLRTSEMFEDDAEYAHYYHAFADKEGELVDLIIHDIWEGYDAYNDPDILIDNPFPFYLIDVETKKVLKKIELSIKKYIRIETVGA